MRQTLKGIAGCVPKMIASERSIVLPATLSLAASVFFGLIMGMLLAWSTTHSSQPPMGATGTKVGLHIAQRLLDIFESRKQDKGETRLPLSGTSIYISAPSPELVRQAKEWIHYTGGDVQESVSSADLSMTWIQQEQRWSLSSLNEAAPELAIIGWFVLRRSAPEFQYSQGVSSLPDPRFATIFVGVKPANETTKLYYIRSMISSLVLFCAIFPSLGLIVLASGILSFEIERERASGALEPFTMATSPLWIMFLSRALARSTLPTACALIMMTIACLFIGFPPVLVLFISVLCLWLLSVVLNLIGQLQAVFFHHRWSRVLSSLLLNPLVSIMLILVFLSHRLIPWMGEKIIDMADDRTSLPLVGWTTQQALTTATIVVPTFLLMIVFLCLAIEWRLGTRRHGLARLD